MANKKQKPIYAIYGPIENYYGRKKLNVTISTNGDINLHYSKITRAANGGTLYFIDKRTCKKYYNELMRVYPQCNAKIEIAKRHNRRTIINIAPGVYISRNTNYYKKLKPYYDILEYMGII